MLIAAARPSASSWAMLILGGSDAEPPLPNSFEIDTARRIPLRPSGEGWEQSEDLHRPFRSIGTVPYHRTPWRRNSLGVVARSCARVRPIPFDRTALGSIRSTRPINSFLSPFQIHLGKEIGSRFVPRLPHVPASNPPPSLPWLGCGRSRREFRRCKDGLGLAWLGFWRVAGCHGRASAIQHVLGKLRRWCVRRRSEGEERAKGGVGMRRRRKK